MEIIDFIETFNTSNSWIDKFKPQKMSEIVGNPKAVYQIVNWLKNFDTNKKEYFEKIKTVKIKKGKKSKTSKPNINKEIEDKDKNKEMDDKINDDIEDIEDPEEDSDIDESAIEHISLPKPAFSNNEKSSCLLITGNHGVGKTCSTYAILHELGYVIQVINFSRIKTHKNISDIIERTSSKINIISSMFNKKNDKFAIVVDELESLASKTEKACITALIKNNELYWTQPIIFISNNQHNKLLGDIKKISYEVKFWQPYDDDVAVLLRRLCAKNSIKLENEIVTQKLIEFSQKDLRRLVMMLQDIKFTYGTSKITEDLVNEYISSSKKKDTDFDLFKATKNLLFNYENIDEAMRYYEIDKTAIPLMTQQNYLLCIGAFTKNNSQKDKLKIACKISSLISKADVIEDFIHREMNWDINIAHAFYSSVAPSYILNKYLLKDRNCNIIYPRDLNKYSIKRINKINIDNVNKIFNNMDIEDYIYLNQIIREQINNNKFRECISNFKDYPNFKVETLERLLKVDKIKCSKTNLKSKEKTEISSYISNRSITKEKKQKKVIKINK